MKKTNSIVLALVLGLASVSPAAEDTWTTRADMPTSRYVVRSTVVDGKVYAIGGDAGIRASRVEAYDPLTDSWTRKASMPYAEGQGGCSAVNGKVYVIGGTITPYGAPLAAVQEYDVATDTWTTKAAMPTARAWLSSSVVNGKIYAIGGTRTYQGTPLSTVEQYDPATDTWTRKADMPTPRGNVSTSAVNGKIYAIGGSPCIPWYQGLSTVEEYDPATDTWTRKADMPTGRTYFSTCAVNGKIYAIGGVKSHESDHVAPVEEYDPATDTWTTKADIPSARSGLATSAVNGKIYAIGGWAGGGIILSTVEEYDPGLPTPDFNGDYQIDIQDLIILIELWGTDEPLCDIAPRPFGDGIIDVQDLELLMSDWGQVLDDPRLMDLWKLDEAEGMFARETVSGNDGIVFGNPVWQPEGGQVDGALEFDGIDDMVIGKFVLNPEEGPFSVFAWVKGGTPGQVIISQQGGVNWLQIDVNGTLMTELTKSGGRTKGVSLYSETVITDDTWHRLGFVWDGSERILYVDDIPVALDSQSGLDGSTGGLVIGVGSGNQTDTFWSGMIDDVRIYNQAVAQ